MCLPDPDRRRLIPALVSFSAGTLMTGALLGLIPQSLALMPSRQVMLTVLAGLLGFFLLEELVLWRHCHDPDCPAHSSAGPLILWADGLHNFADGVAIAAAFGVSPGLGVATTLAVVAHEVPQELGDLAILLDAGYPPRRAFLLNLVSSLATLPGALLAHLFCQGWLWIQPCFLALAGASFLYVAVADLIPQLHRPATARARGLRLACLAAGCLLMIALSGRHAPPPAGLPSAPPDRDGPRAGEVRHLEDLRAGLHRQLDPTPQGSA